MVDYPSNSHKSREEARESERRYDKIVSSPVKTRKRNEMRKFADIFVPDDVQSVKSYILTDVIVPLIKNAISQTVDTLLYPDGSGRSKKSSMASKVSYRSYYDRSGDSRRDYNSPRPRTTGYDYEDVILPNRGEAEEVLMRLHEIVAEYKMVRVADFYDLVGVSGSFTDNNYGWTNLDSAKVIPVRPEGYLIKLPKAVPLD